MKRVWPDTFVEEGNLTQNISLLRKALGESPGGMQFIETVPRRGYRFVAAISEKGSETAAYAPVVSAEVPVAAAVTSSSRRRTPFVLGAALVVVGIIGVMYFTSKAGNTAAIQSIAVLPFVDESADPDAEYINDKIAESLINSLSKLPQLRVVPRSVVASYKGKAMDPRKIGEELNVRAVVTGHMRRHGDVISIQADLIDLQNVAQLWGQHYDHKVSDVLLVQDDISRDIFENLRLKLNVEEKKQLEAYRLYLKGRNAWNKRTGDAFQEAIELFQPGNRDRSQQLRRLRGSRRLLQHAGRLRPTATEGRLSEGQGRGGESARIDESLRRSPQSMAFIKFRWDWDRAETEREFQSAIKLKPAYAPAHQWYSSYLVAVERFDEAIAEAKRTEELEPLSFVASSHLGWIYYLSGHNDKAIEQCRKILELDPSSFPARRYLGLAYEAKGMYPEAIAEFQTGVKLSGSPLMLALLGHAYAVAGKKAEAQQVLNDLQQLQEQRYVSPYTVAAIYTGLGNQEQAFKWLDRAVEERDIWLMNLKVDPVFAKLRSERKFTDILARIRLRP